VAFANIQSKQGSGTTQNLAVTVTSSTANSLMVVGTMMNTTSRTLSSVTDNASTPNTYTIGNSGTPSDRGTAIRVYQSYGVQTTAGTTTVTSNLDASNLQHVAVDEFSGGATSGVELQASTGNGGSGGSLSVTSFTPTTGSLIVGTGGSGGSTTFTAGTNFTLGGNTARIGQDYRLSASGSETAPISQSPNQVWAEVAIEYKIGTQSFSYTGTTAASSGVDGVYAPTHTFPYTGTTAATSTIVGSYSYTPFVVGGGGGGSGQPIYSGFFGVPEYVRRRERERRLARFSVRGVASARVTLAVASKVAGTHLTPVMRLVLARGGASLRLTVSVSSTARGEFVSLDELEMEELQFLGIL
jgi:hypothetical protein